MRAVIFCSNPVEGGTARMFFEVVNTLRGIQKDLEIIPVVNENNPVSIYKKIPGIVYLPVQSEQLIFKEKYGNRGAKRIIDFLMRKLLYRKIYKKNIQTMVRFLKEANIDTVIIHNGGYLGDDLCNQMLTAAYKNRNILKNRIMVFHSDMNKNLLRKFRYFFYDRKIDIEASELITVSKFTRNRIKNSSYIRRDISVIYNGIRDLRVKEYFDKQRVMGDLPDGFNVLMIGNFQENKGQIKLIEALNDINKKNIFVTIIGNIYDEAYYRKCIKKIQEFGLDKNVRIFKGITDAYEYIDMFDLLAVTSIYDESFGLISVEAMIAQVPVVAFSCGGIPEVVEDGLTGILIDVGDVKKLSEALLWFSNHKEESREMGKAGRDRYESNFSVEAMGREYLFFLKENCGLI